ncbi:HAD family hydrolase [Thermodesulfobacteriota bacterium]
MPANQIPYKSLKTIFLDAGNTIVSMDLEWVRSELKRCGVLCEVQTLRRAEAAVRPIVSAELKRLKSTEDQSTFAFYMRSILRQINVTSGMEDREHDEIIQVLLPVLQAPGQSHRLWSHLLPGVRDALDILQGRGLQLVVVSNADGTVEKGMANLGLLHYFDKVVDSHIVGFEKPDPRLFYHALEISKAVPEKTIHVGDMYHVDILGAWSAGLHALLIDPFGDWDNPDCARVPDLLSFANKMAGFV